MKARVKATGEIIEVNQCAIIHDDGTREIMRGTELDEVQGAPDYWTKLEHQYAGMIVQGMVEHNGINFLNDAILNVAAQKAHALVEKMKEERK